jgi:membrane-bound serine protease (ClpP class)
LIVNIRLVTLLLLAAVSWGGLDLRADEAVASGKRKVYVLPLREAIMPPLVYLVRRGVKEAMDAKADLLVLDMDTNGGRVDVTEDIIEILNNFKGQTATFVNRKAFSAGAFISVATQKIFMAPQSVIGAAAPIMLIPGGAPQDMPETMQAKMNSALRALVRTSAEKNGYNIEVVEAMIDKSKELKIDGKVLNEKGQILTLTNTEAEREYGDPPKRLLSSGTVESLDELLKNLGYSDAVRVNIQPTGAEQVAMWINMISPLLLIIGIAGIYIEFKTPGFGLPGIVGIVAFALYFLGGYIAGLSGLEWIAVFLVGLALVALELFVFPGTTALGLIGTALMVVALVMAMVDVYPGMPALPTFKMLELPLRDLFIAFLGGAGAVLVLSRWLPKTSFYGKLVSQAASGVTTEAKLEQRHISRLGQVGVAISPLRPGGKAQFGNEILDVISQGDLIDKGQRVKIIGHSGTEAVVEAEGR